MATDTQTLSALVARLRQANSTRNTIENGRRREPADTRRLELANEEIEAVLRQLEQSAKNTETQEP